MSTQARFFVPPDAIEDGVVRFARDQARQMATVLRLTVGARVTVLDNSGWQYEVVLDRVSSVEALGVVRLRSLVTSEPRTKISLYVGMIRASKLEIVFQKGTELGVAAFAPILCQRSLVGQADDLGPGKLDRWTRIVVEAAEQCGRGKLPVIHPAVPFGQALDQVRGLSLILWEGERELTLREALRPAGTDGGSPRRRSRTSDSGGRNGTGRPFAVNVFVGPEGGFTGDEVDRARAAGIVPITLGPRILRAETASIAVAAAILYGQGDLG